jgi:hypothetical protein
MSILKCIAAGITHPISVMITESHSVATSAATIICKSTSLDVGDVLTVYLGYTDNCPQIFTGYIKQIEKNVPENTITITASDKMIRAVDYFIVADDPNNLTSYKNIAAEELVRQLLAMAGLTSYTYDTTYFTFGISHDFNVNLVPVFDYCRAIGDALTWHLWCDSTGKSHFENRKPYVMTGDTGQPGDTTDETPLGMASHVIEKVDTNTVYFSTTDTHLRNRVVVYGADGVHYTASAESPYLPDGFYKSVVADLTTIVDDTSMAHKIADYNLNLLNRLTYSARLTTIGDPDIAAREIVRLRNSYLNIDSNWYVYSCEHQWGQGGYICSLDLRQ